MTSNGPIAGTPGRSGGRKRDSFMRSWRPDLQGGEAETAVFGGVVVSEHPQLVNSRLSNRRWVKFRRPKKLMLCLGSCLLTLLVLEICLRLYGYDRLRALHNGEHLILQPSAHPILKYELAPGASSWAWGANVTINSRGFRGAEPATGHYGGYRILILGDSIAFGNELEVEATFSHKLQQQLLKSMDCEVLNFGIGGYDSLQEVALLEYRGLEYKSDLVVVAYCLNDAGIASANLEFLETLQSLTTSHLYLSRLVQFVSERLERAKQKTWTMYRNTPLVFRREHEQQIADIGDDDNELLALMAGVVPVYPSNWYGDPDRIGRLRFAFQWLQELSSENGFSVLVMIIPWLDSGSEGYRHTTAHRIVELEAQRVGFDTIDLTGQFMQAGVENLRIKSRDPLHPNEAGHSIIAQELLKYVRSHTKRMLHPQ